MLVVIVIRKVIQDAVVNQFGFLCGIAYVMTACYIHIGVAYVCVIIGYFSCKFVNVQVPIIRLISVDFPAPLAPAMAYILPLVRVALKLRITCFASSDAWSGLPYAKPK